MLFGTSRNIGTCEHATTEIWSFERACNERKIVLLIRGNSFVIRTDGVRVLEHFVWQSWYETVWPPCRSEKDASFLERRFSCLM